MIKSARLASGVIKRQTGQKPSICAYFSIYPGFFGGNLVQNSPAPYTPLRLFLA